MRANLFATVITEGVIVYINIVTRTEDSGYSSFPKVDSHIHSCPIIPLQISKLIFDKTNVFTYLFGGDRRM